jgi:hypothetical protein
MLSLEPNIEANAFSVASRPGRVVADGMMAHRHNMIGPWSDQCKESPQKASARALRRQPQPRSNHSLRTKHELRC